MQDEQKNLSENDEGSLPQEEQISMEPICDSGDTSLERTVCIPDNEETEDNSEGKTRLFDAPCKIGRAHV